MIFRQADKTFTLLIHVFMSDLYLLEPRELDLLLQQSCLIFAEEEKKAFEAKLLDVLNFLSCLKELGDLTEVPSYTPMGYLVLREDHPNLSQKRETILQNAVHAQGYFTVPRFLET